MTATEAFDTEGFIRGIINRGWHWDGPHADRLVHPTNHEFFVKYDSETGRLTLSPQLDEHLKLVIPTPASKSKTFR
jgi:hypothetical protein